MFWRAALLRDCGLGVLHMRTKQPGIGGGPPRAISRARYSDGERPIAPLKRALNDPRLEKPTR